jgi:hypothetical protein
MGKNKNKAKNKDKNWSLLICLALALITLAVFCQVHSFEFITLDDPDYVYENPNVQAGITLQTINWAFTTDTASNWHPLTWLSHMLDWQLYGASAGGHHITNLIFHIANALLLFIVLKQMTNALWQSAFAAALFALHPLHVESVAWVAERKDVLSTFFWILTMWAYLRYVKRPKVSGYLLITVFFALGLMAKPMLVTLPFVLLLLDYWPLERFGQRTFFYLIREKIPFMALSAVSSIVTFFVQRDSKAVISLVLFPLRHRVFNSFISYVEYMWKMFRPARLAFFYPNPGQNVSASYAVLSAVFLLVLTILVLVFAKNHRYLITGWFWYLGTLVPVIGLVQVGNQAMADRYSYITLTGLFIIIAWGVPELLAKLPQRKIVLWMSSFMVLSALAICTYRQTRYWKDTIAIHQHALRVTKDNFLVHNSIALQLLKRGQTEQAISHYSEAVRIQPDNPSALNGLGVALCYAGKVDQAIVYYEKSLSIQPKNVDTHNNLGIAFCWQGKFDRGIEHFKQALQIDPDCVDAKNNLIMAQQKKQQSQN